MEEESRISGRPWLQTPRRRHGASPRVEVGDPRARGSHPAQGLRSAPPCSRAASVVAQGHKMRQGERRMGEAFILNTNVL